MLVSYWISKFKKNLPTILVTLGMVLIVNVSWPIISHLLFVAPSLERSELITPISMEQIVYAAPQILPQPIAPNTKGMENKQVLGTEVDYTNASNWFPKEMYPENAHESKITHYKISIPKVNIEDAVVEIGGEDLSNSLVQYPGTADPGQLGSPVIFGHSVLRQFYNPKVENPRRYVSIFSKIMTLKDGDEIIVEYDGIVYTYKVKDKFQVKPEDVYILSQRYDDKELKLVTCVPEGTYLRRGVIVAQLQDIGQNRNSL